MVCAQPAPASWPLHFLPELSEAQTENVSLQSLPLVLPEVFADSFEFMTERARPGLA